VSNNPCLLHLDGYWVMDLTLANTNAAGAGDP
jgi:hypothetical protein